MYVLVKEISKKYGNKKVLNNVTLKFGKGINCVLGVNGVGKSTLLNIILNLIEPDEGEVIINDMTYRFESQSISIKLQIGGSTDISKLMPELTIEEYLHFLSSLYKLERLVAKKRIDTLISYFFDDISVKMKLISSLSTGMQKKVELISSLIHNPSIIVLDEPFSGLDPFSSQRLIALLISLKNKVVIISSHDLDYIEECAEFIHVINNANIDYSGPLNDFKGNYQSLLQKFAAESKQLTNNITNINWLLNE